MPRPDAPEDIEINAVHRKLRQRLAQDFQHIFALESAVDAGVHVPVIVHNIALRRAVGPFRMLFVDLTANLGKVRARDDADALAMADVDHFFHAVSLQIRTLRVIF